MRNSQRWILAHPPTDPVPAAFHRADRRVRAPLHCPPGARNRLCQASLVPWAAYNSARSHPCQKSIRCKSLFLKSPPALILASTSVYRRELLARLRLAFSCIAPGVDETRRAGERPLDLAVRLARAKAAAVALQHPDAWVIGSDQVAVRAGSSGEVILGKPGTP